MVHLNASFPMLAPANIKLSTLKPIEFILPNSIVSQTQWRTQMPGEQEITVSMEHLYLMLKYVLGYMYKPGLPSSIISPDLFDRPTELLSENKFEIIDHYGFPLTIIISLLLAAFFVPIFWLLCCCFCSNKPAKRSQRKYARPGQRSSGGGGRSSGRGGTSSQHSSRSTRVVSKHRSSLRHKMEGPCDFCLRPLFSTVLLTLMVVCFLFIICAFVTNDMVLMGVHRLPRAVNNTLADFEIYLNNTQYEMDILFRTNFAQLDAQIQHNLNMSGEIVKNKLAIVSEAISIDNLTQIVSNLQPILVDLKKLINNTNELKLLTTQLKGKINRSKQDVDEFFRLCRHPVCRELEDKYQSTMQSFTISSKIDSLPRLSPIIGNIEYLLDKDIVSEIKKGKDRLDFVSREIQKVVNKISPTIQSNIKRADKLLNENMDKLNNVIAQPIEGIRGLQRQVDQSNEYLVKNDIYFHYFGIVSAITLFSILISYFLGLLCAVCGDRPTRYNYRNRSKKAECFFYGGASIFFLTFTILLLLGTISFSIGGLSNRSMCYYLRDTSQPNSERLINLVQDKLESIVLDHDKSRSVKAVFGHLKGVHVVDLLNRCHRNQSLFNVLQLTLNQRIALPDGGKLNLKEIVTFKEQTEIENYLKKLLDNVDVNPSNIVLLSREGQELIQMLQDTPLEMLNFTSFASIIKHSITPINLEVISKHLEEESLRLPESEIENVARLRNIAIDLKSANHLITLITNKIENLTRHAEIIERKSHYNGKGMRTTLQMLIKQAHEAQRFINQRGKDEIKNVLKNFIDDVGRLITQYTTHVQSRIQNEIGRCEPLSRAYNHTVASLCDDIVLPFTASWFSIIATLLLYLPSTLIVCILVALFNKIERYASSRRESILIIDNYEEDDIPLADLDKETTRRVVPSAPLRHFGDNHSEEETWSPTSLPQHHYSRPPPYNF